MTQRAMIVHNSHGQHPVVLVCEHASATIPPQYDNLGISAEAARSHIAWDPGAVVTARYLANQLDAVLVEGAISRLVYDCNRPPESPGAMPERSEIFDIPGNRNLSDKERANRISSCYEPFKNSVASILADHPSEPVLVTVHSFTPVYNGERRAVEIGILHDDDARLADAILDVAEGFCIQRNQPYGPEDGVTHTLKLHGIRNSLHNVMIEIRNDLLETDVQCQQMAAHLEHWLSTALTQPGNAASLTDQVLGS